MFEQMASGSKSGLAKLVSLLAARKRILNCGIDCKVDRLGGIFRKGEMALNGW
jgi:Leu/Phe-tRNA-protein transferase